MLLNCRNKHFSYVNVFHYTLEIYKDPAYIVKFITQILPIPCMAVFVNIYLLSRNFQSYDIYGHFVYKISNMKSSAPQSQASYNVRGSAAVPLSKLGEGAQGAPCHRTPFFGGGARTPFFLGERTHTIFWGGARKTFFGGAYTLF